MSLQKDTRLRVTLCSLVCILLLAGCDLGGGTSTTPAATATSGTPALDSSPKGPGGITATVSSSSACSISSAAPASTGGWKGYRDGRFPFKFAVPPGWRAGSFTDDSGNDYIVQVFPPGSTTPIGQAGISDPEHFAITITLSGPAGTYGSDPNWRADARQVTINHVATTLYDRTSPDCEEFNRGATGDFGRHHFTFYMVSSAGKERNDSALFLGMLQSFAYTG